MSPFAHSLTKQHLGGARVAPRAVLVPAEHSGRPLSRPAGRILAGSTCVRFPTLRHGEYEQSDERNNNAKQQEIAEAILTERWKQTTRKTQCQPTMGSAHSAGRRLGRDRVKRVCFHPRGGC